MPISTVEFALLGMLLGIIAASFFSFDSRRGEPETGYGYICFMATTSGFMASGLIATCCQSLNAVGCLTGIPVFLLLARPQPGQMVRPVRLARSIFAVVLGGLWIALIYGLFGLPIQIGFLSALVGATIGLASAIRLAPTAHPDWNWGWSIYSCGYLKMVAMVVITSVIASAIVGYLFGSSTWWLMATYSTTFAIFAWPRAGREEVT